MCTLPYSQLAAVDWQLSVTLATDAQSQLRDPTAQFDLTVLKANVAPASLAPHSQEPTHTRVEFSKTELLEFYNKVYHCLVSFRQLEIIQSQLDQLA
jgi:hypothetical protein